MNEIYFATKMNINGNRVELSINTQEKTFKYGYDIFLGKAYTLSLKDIKELYHELLKQGFTQK